MSRGEVPLVLASASPRRREILGVLGLSFDVVPSDVDESRRDGEPAMAWVRRAACEKADDVAARLARTPAPFVLGADTIVVVDGEPLGKPRDDDDARRMIAALAGRWHEVATGIAIARAGHGIVHEQTVVTRVRFRELDARAIDAYVASGEGRDKAGAYGVQGLASGMVVEVEGSYHNVVGLPAAETVAALVSVGALAEWP